MRGGRKSRRFMDPVVHRERSDLLEAPHTVVGEGGCAREPLWQAVVRVARPPHASARPLQSHGGRAHPLRRVHCRRPVRGARRERGLGRLGRRRALQQRGRPPAVEAPPLRAPLRGAPGSGGTPRGRRRPGRRRGHCGRPGHRAGTRGRRRALALRHAGPRLRRPRGGRRRPADRLPRRPPPLPGAAGWRLPLGPGPRRPRRGPALHVRAGRRGARRRRDHLREAAGRQAAARTGGRAGGRRGGGTRFGVVRAARPVRGPSPRGRARRAPALPGAFRDGTGPCVGAGVGHRVARGSLQLEAETPSWATPRWQAAA
mmetsp:Transcript_59003/g.182950  ORF Transcript_59003/g.182950 Transcript_59003/m.182950 type:complete len:315 (-) Transcript_59003:270-1214(-)